MTGNAIIRRHKPARLDRTTFASPPHQQPKLQDHRNCKRAAHQCTREAQSAEVAHESVNARSRSILEQLQNLEASKGLASFRVPPSDQRAETDCEGEGKGCQEKVVKIETPQGGTCHTGRPSQ